MKRICLILLLAVMLLPNLSRATADLTVYQSSGMYYLQNKAGQVIMSSSDATAVINAAIANAASGDTILIEPGTYTMTSSISSQGKNGITLTLASGTKITIPNNFGNGANTAIIELESVSNWVIQGDPSVQYAGEIDGNGANQVGTTNHDIYLYNCTNCILQNIYIHNIRMNAIDIVSSSGCKVLNSYVNNIAANGIDLGASWGVSSNCLAQGNLVEHYNELGIDIMGSQSQIMYNTVQNPGSSYSGYYSPVNNVLSWGIGTENPNQAGGANVPPTNNLIQGNIVSGYNSIVQGQDSVSATTSNQILNNNVSSNGWCIRIMSGNGNTISNNILSGTGIGIYFDSYSASGFGTSNNIGSGNSYDSLPTHVLDQGTENSVNSNSVQQCSDGTPYGSCSATKPLYCSNGNLINACGSPYNCGCSSGICQSNGTCSQTNCNNMGLGTPSISPSNPAVNQQFQILCPVTQTGDCIYAYANGSSNNCPWSNFSGGYGHFVCSGLPSGSYTATCKSIAGTNSNCCSDTKTSGYSIAAASNLVGYWNFNEGTGTTAKDSSGYGHTGTLYNSPVWVAGKSGDALQFNGVNQYATANNIPVNTSPGAQNTVSFWMKWTGTDNQMLVMFPQNFYDIMFYNHCFGFNTGNGDIIGIPESNIPLNQWVHVAGIFYNGVPSSSNLALYINGVKQNMYQCSSSTTQTKSVNSTVEIGGGWGSNYYFGGIIDEVKVWNRALSASEILNEYKGVTYPASCTAIRNSDNTIGWTCIDGTKGNFPDGATPSNPVQQNYDKTTGILSLKVIGMNQYYYTNTVNVVTGQASGWVNAGPVTQTCTDGTPYGSCSATKPLYCSSGTLINACSTCGCPSGQTCNATSGACYTTPPCNAGCILGGVCSSSCSGVNGCTNYITDCNGKVATAVVCVNSYQYAKCCNGAATSCGTRSISCPSAYCSGNSICSYPSTASCSNPCSGGSCGTCTPACTATCTACGTGLTCNSGKCVVVCTGKNCPIPNEQAPSTPVSSTWDFAIVILAIIGLCLGYFILKDVLSVSAESKVKKRK